jgi:hypothetical protein
MNSKQPKTSWNSHNSIEKGIGSTLTEEDNDFGVDFSHNFHKDCLIETIK